MLRAPLLLGGAAVSLLALAAIVRPAAGDDTRAADPPVEIRAPHAEPVREMTPASAPRGNLRGDIVNNARSHPEPPHAPSARKSR
ncbi:hypothetical protein [Trinickia fusca]|uniref:Uncharacterized protein n=1 Tax=Trinickia fusca TaxID=2419777 RepID=A0A494XR12_9BURK|nr:hypothetical protein [Trinickia fusca]RKP52262.1 hypothetical protein D7S89_01630 [Trinickia fusca]